MADGALRELGTLVPRVIEPLARTADRHPPVLRPYNARGERIDEIEFHPAYKELESTVLRFGAVRAGYAPGWRGPFRTRATEPGHRILYLHPRVRPGGHRLPDRDDGRRGAVPRAQRPGAGSALRARASSTTPAITSRSRCSSPRRPEDRTSAPMRPSPRRAGDGTWRLSGEKWFASCAHSDLILVLARPVGAPPGPRGLGLFLMPRTPR